MMVDKVVAGSIWENYFSKQAIQIGGEINILEKVILSYSEKYPLV
jgi:hypothetical protein